MIITDCFIERPQFAKWREESNLWRLAEKVIRENTEWSWRTEKLRYKTPGCRGEVESLYEFLAARGHLMVFDATWDAIEEEERGEGEG